MTLRLPLNQPQWNSICQPIRRCPLQPAALPWRCLRAAHCSGLASHSDSYDECSPLIQYDEYYHGDCLPDEREIAVRDVSWAELTRKKEFQREDRSSFNAHLKVSGFQSATYMYTTPSVR